MSSEESIKDLNENRTEAIQALLNSLAPNASGQENGEGKLSKEQVRKLSDKLGEILGDQADLDDGARRNEKGELVNEEGLPIIDITEPVPSGDTASIVPEISSFDDPDLLPLWALSPEEKARRKAERERMLDALEEEERLEQLREAEVARAKWQEEVEKRKEAQKVEMENLKRARELQKKMGRALLRSVVQNREEEEKRKADIEKADQEAAAVRKASSLKPKKSVTFADEHQDIEEGTSPEAGKKGKNIDWGDVVPARLRPIDESVDRTPMKRHVVERHPKALRAPEPSILQGDSDDEDEPGFIADADSDIGEVLRSDHSSEDGEHPDSPQSYSDADDDLPPDEEPGDWGTEDFDYARHQREVALEYYEKRKTIGAEVASAMRAHSHDDDDWNQSEVPLEASLAATPRHSMSRFSANYLNRPSTPESTLASHSLGGSVLPASQSTSLRRAARMGKLEDGKLVGGEEGDSDGEVSMTDENTRAMLEMLRKGEVTNIGPKRLATSTQETSSAKLSQGLPPTKSTSSAKPLKVSKFKMSLGHPVSPAFNVPGSGTDSSVSTPMDTGGRSSPKVVSPGGPFSPELSSTPEPERMPSRIIESPDFPRPVHGQVPSTIVESPDFPRPGSMQIPSMILESEDFLRSNPTSARSLSPASSTVVPSTVASTQASPAVVTPLRPSVVERRPPTIVSTRQVTEGNRESQGGKPKVSRFKAQGGQ